jgi:hypothetical protein
MAAAPFTAGGGSIYRAAVQSSVVDQSSASCDELLDLLHRLLDAFGDRLV